MKKILLSIAAVASMSLVACGGSEKAAQETADSATVEATEVVTEAGETAAPIDAAAATGLIDQIKGAATSENVQKAINYVKQLISEGKLSEAQKYLNEVKPYAEKVGLTNAINTAQQALTVAESGLGESAKEAVTEAANAKKEEIKGKVEDKADELKAKAEDKAQEAEQAVKNLFK